MPLAPTPPAQRCMQAGCLNLGFQRCNPKPLAGKHGQTLAVPVGCGGKGWSCVATGWVGARRQPGQRKGKRNAAEVLMGSGASCQELPARAGELRAAGAFTPRCLYGNIMGKRELLPFWPLHPGWLTDEMGQIHPSRTLGFPAQSDHVAISQPLGRSYKEQRFSLGCGFCVRSLHWCLRWRKPKVCFA